MQEQAWLQKIAVKNFVSRFQDKDNLVNDLEDIVSENPASEKIVVESLEIAGLQASEVLNYINENSNE